MNKKILWITKTAMLLALLICLQWVGSMIPVPMAKQLITGTLVNCVLAIAVLYVGWSSGITISLISPVCAFFLTIAPNFITVAPIMLGNVCFVVLLRWIAGGKAVWKKPVGLIAASGVKFAVLYVLVVKIICGIAADGLAGKQVGPWKVVMPPVLMFAWPQLVTALTGGAIALLILPALKRIDNGK